MSISEIVVNIDERLAELDTEAGHLRGARAALVGEAPPAPAPAPAPARTPSHATPSRATPKPRRRPRRPKERTAYDVVPVGKLLARLSGSPGLRSRELAQANNADPAQVLVLLREQEEAGQVRRTGTRATTRWHAVTDEDRIAARVAELEASRRTSPAPSN